MRKGNVARLLRRPYSSRCLQQAAWRADSRGAEESAWATVPQRMLFSCAERCGAAATQGAKPVCSWRQCLALSSAQALKKAMRAVCGTHSAARLPQPAGLAVQQFAPAAQVFGSAPAGAQALVRANLEKAGGVGSAVCREADGNARL